MGITDLMGLSWVKVVGALMLAAAVFGAGVGAGHKWGYASATLEAQVKIDKANGETAQIKADFDQLTNQFNEQKVEWQKTLAKAATEAAQTLKEAEDKVRASEAASQAKITQINKDWQTKVQGVQNEKQALLDSLKPVSAADFSSDDGLWVDVYTASCEPNSGTGGGHDQGTATGDGHQLDSQRCRLHESTARRLVETASKANELVATYNQCVNSLNVVTGINGAIP